MPSATWVLSCLLVTDIDLALALSGSLPSLLLVWAEINFSLLILCLPSIPESRVNNNIVDPQSHATNDDDDDDCSVESACARELTDARFFPDGPEYSTTSSTIHRSFIP
ncbi:hypothetical protein G7054_g3088 [Neopestalotiopsis clavispora]|nr:hypothetical protein G7054_g3088 [Neopestalotiopsis clavispora]